MDVIGRLYDMVKQLNVRFTRSVITILTRTVRLYYKVFFANYENL